MKRKRKPYTFSQKPRHLGALFAKDKDVGIAVLKNVINAGHAVTTLNLHHIIDELASRLGDDISPEEIERVRRDTPSMMMLVGLKDFQ